MWGLKGVQVKIGKKFLCNIPTYDGTKTSGPYGYSVQTCRSTTLFENL